MHKMEESGRRRSISAFHATGRDGSTAVSAHLSNTTAQRCDGASQLRKDTDKNNVDTIAGDFNTRERGKAEMSSIEETWEAAFPSPPPDVVPMWGQMEDSGDCCGLI